MMVWRCLISLVLVWSLWPLSTSGAEPVTIPPEALKAMAAGVRQLVEDDEAVGAEVLVMHKRKVVLHEAFGYSDLDRRIPLARNTIVCVRSMTKPLVGTAIQMLIDEAKLSLTDRASKYLKSFDNDKSRAVTIEQLLTHTAGFPLTLVNKQLSSYSGQRAIVDEAGKIGPSGPPGSFKYSDTDSETLAAIVAEVSGKPVDTFIRRRILEPLGMSDTYCVLEKDAPPRSRVSSNHAGSPGLWHKYWDHEAIPFFPYFLGAAALYSTTTDYARFLTLWLDRGRAGGHRLLSEAAVERALRPLQRMLSPGSNTPYPTFLTPLQPFYGQHWMVYVPPTPASGNALPVFGHGGSDGTLALVFPEHDLMVFYFTQSRGGMSVFRFEELLAPLVGLKSAPPRSRLTMDRLAPLTGDYVAIGGQKRAWVTVHGQRLRIELAGQGALLPLWPDNSGRWSFGESAAGVSVSFDETDTGHATAMKLWHNTTQLFDYRRVPPASDLPTVDRLMSLRREKQGGDRIDELQGLEMNGKLQVGAARLDTTLIAAAPNRVIRRIKSQAGVVTTLVDGRSARKLSPGEPVEELAGLWLDEARRINPFARLRDWRASASAVRVVGKDKLGSEDVWIVRVDGEFEPPQTRYVSVKSGLLLKEEGWITAKGLGTVSRSVAFEDYREVAGVKLPFRLTTESAVTGKQVMQFAECRPNPVINAATFSLPKQ
jgi:CubicO group peptidase (beta-lactamase class C family)